MWHRLPRSEYERQKGDGNKAAMRQIINTGEEPGILAYYNGEPIAWCAVAPREAYSALARSRIMAPFDAQPAWAITCLFIAKPWRRKALSVQLIQAAVAFANSKGANIVEGYPVEPKSPDMAPAFISMGIASAFRDAGFVEVERRSPTRPFMRYVIETS